MSLKNVAHELVCVAHRDKNVSFLAAVATSFLSSQQHCGVLLNVSTNGKTTAQNYCKTDKQKLITMEQKIQLKHPTGKKAVNMDKEKYDILKKYLLSHLKNNGQSTHTELLNSITKSFKGDKIKFSGSVEWHMEWVKLDLEARKIIKGTADKSPIQFSFNK